MFLHLQHKDSHCILIEASKWRIISNDLWFSSVQLLSCVWLFATPWIAAHQASLSITNSPSSLKLMCIELVMPSSHLILCHFLLLLPQSLPVSGSFPMSQLFAWGGQRTGVSASASVLPINTQDWSPLEWTDWISLQSKGLSRVFSNTTVEKHQFFSAQLSSQSNSLVFPTKIFPVEYISEIMACIFKYEYSVLNHSGRSFFFLHICFNPLEFKILLTKNRDFPSGSDGEESACSAGDLSSISQSGKSSGEGNGYPFWYSCLENSMDRGAWRAKVHGVAKSWTQLRD